MAICQKPDKQTVNKILLPDDNLADFTRYRLNKNALTLDLFMNAFDVILQYFFH